MKFKQCINIIAKAGTKVYFDVDANGIMNEWEISYLYFEDQK